MEEQKKESVMKYSCRKREIEQTKLYSTPVWRNRRRETVMTYSCRRREMEQTKLCSAPV